MKLTSRCLLFNISDEHFQIVTNMMRHFCPAKHFAYKRLEENISNNEFKIHNLDASVSKLYNLNSRQAKDSIEQARQTIISQVKL